MTHRSTRAKNDAVRVHAVSHELSQPSRVTKETKNKTHKSAAMTTMSERPSEMQEGVDFTLSEDNTVSLDKSTMECIEQNVLKSEEQDKNATKEPESWRDAAPHENSQTEALPAVLSSPEAAPSVTLDRKNELLLQARADRISWIQNVSLPYETTIADASHSTDKNDPWNHDDRLSLLKDSNAVQSLPCIPQVLSSLYGMEQGTSENVANRIQTVVSSLDCSLLCYRSREAHVCHVHDCSWNRLVFTGKNVSWQPQYMFRILWL